jgi:hypothetical protein
VPVDSGLPTNEAQIRGNIRVEDFLNILPQVFADQASEVNNGATGTATLNLMVSVPNVPWSCLMATACLTALQTRPRQTWT